MSRYQRLSVLDRTFLDFESDAYPQHVGATLIFEVGPLRNEAGGIDADRIRDHIAARLHRIPRYRQRLAWIPVENHPVWVDDDRFNVHYHVRHASLPKPGTERQLKRLAARIMSQRLDRGRPLWELWIIEGLEGDRGALISKTHHCMIDGIAGVDLLTIVLSPTPEPPASTPPRWLPEPPPSAVELATSEVARRAFMPLEAARALVGAALAPNEAIAKIREQAAALGEALGAGLVPASDTPLNRDLGPHRRFDWWTLDLAPVREIKKRLGGTVNDVVLASVAGALGLFLEQRGIARSRQRDMHLRAMVPVSVRPHAQRGITGNQIALWAARLPVDETDPRRRLAAVAEITRNLKDSKQALGAEVLAAVSEWTVPTLLSLASRVAYRNRAANLVVTNVPGPQIPLYLLGARVLETYPMLNLLTRQSLGVALFSYAGRMHWGFMADWDLVPDLHDFVRFVERSFGELCDAAEVQRPG
ncbi:MAG: wax ester/triacylglycerol synthase family O-acyltransferase [Proteobacteria bacterium]|nr:MAG: wax ester/triacylglycerol synthase family O-acyltransferase [Pseudomonadota bacterium]